METATLFIMKCALKKLTTAIGEMKDILYCLFIFVQQNFIKKLYDLLLKAYA